MQVSVEIKEQEQNVFIQLEEISVLLECVIDSMEIFLQLSNDMSYTKEDIKKLKQRNASYSKLVKEITGKNNESDN